MGVLNHDGAHMDVTLSQKNALKRKEPESVTTPLPLPPPAKKQKQEQEHKKTTNDLRYFHFMQAMKSEKGEDVQRHFDPDYFALWVAKKCPHATPAMSAIVHTCALQHFTATCFLMSQFMRHVQLIPLS